MRAVVQRVSTASVAIDGETVATIAAGMLVLLGIEAADTPEDGMWLAQKLSRLRIFPDEAASMNRSIVDAGGEFLVISQFTLHASLAKGTRPSFHGAARPEIARPIYELFLSQLAEASGRPVRAGRFGAMMAVSLVNDGPVTLLLDTKRRE